MWQKYKEWYNSVIAYIIWALLSRLEQNIYALLKDNKPFKGFVKEQQTCRGSIPIIPYWVGDEYRPVFWVIGDVTVDLIFVQFILVQPVYVQFISSNPKLIGLDEMDWTEHFGRKLGARM